MQRFKWNKHDIGEYLDIFISEARSEARNVDSSMPKRSR